MSVYLITGASRGIGYELCKQLVARGDVVIAAARTPEKAANLKELEGSHSGKLHLLKLDVEDASTIKSAAATLEKNFPGGLDVLINNAGISGSFVQCSQETVDNVMAVHKVNVLGPMLVTQAMLPLLRKGSKKLIANVSSGAGSLAGKVKFVEDAEIRKTLPYATQALAYKQSKAALNMQTLTFAADLKDEGFTVISYCPGWVATDMGLQGQELMKTKANPTWTTEQSVELQIKLLDGLTPDKSGGYFQHTGETLDW